MNEREMLRLINRLASTVDAMGKLVAASNEGEKQTLRAETEPNAVKGIWGTANMGHSYWPIFRTTDAAREDAAGPKAYKSRKVEPHERWESVDDDDVIYEEYKTALLATDRKFRWCVLLSALNDPLLARRDVLQLCRMAHLEQ